MLMATRQDSVKVGLTRNDFNAKSHDLRGKCSNPVRYNYRMLTHTHKLTIEFDGVTVTADLVAEGYRGRRPTANGL